MRKPTPGSDEAQQQGCLCPVLDNNHGAGLVGKDGKPNFWIVQDCPLHGFPASKHGFYTIKPKDEGEK